MDTDKQIDRRFKILYAVGAVLVCCGHTSGGGISLFRDWFPYSGYHLALFVFGSGYFYRSASEENVAGYVYKKFKALIIPLYVYTLVYGLIVQLSRLKGFEIGRDITAYNLLVAPVVSGHQFIYNMGGWFVVPLFMVELLNILFRKIFRRINMPEWVFFVIGTAIGIAGNQLACSGYNTGWWLVPVRMLYFLPFYELGILYRNKLEAYDRKIPDICCFAAVFAVALTLICIYGKPLSYTPSWCNDFTEGPVLPFVTGVLGIVLWLRISTLLEPVIGKSRCVNLIADNSYSIMMNQFLGYMLIKTVYALISRTGVCFADFDLIKYKTDIWWYYTPGGIKQTLIIYPVAGIAFSIAVQKAIDFIKTKLKLPSARLRN